MFFFTFLEQMKKIRTSENPYAARLRGVLLLYVYLSSLSLSLSLSLSKGNKGGVPKNREGGDRMHKTNKSITPRKPAPLLGFGFDVTTNNHAHKKNRASGLRCRFGRLDGLAAIYLVITKSRRQPPSTHKKATLRWLLVSAGGFSSSGRFGIPTSSS